MDQKSNRAALQQRVEELNVLNTLGRRVSTTLSVDQVTEAALEMVMGCTAPNLTMLYLKEGDKLHLKGIKTDTPKYQSVPPAVKRVGECLCGLAASEKKPFYSSNIHTDPLCTLDECKKAGLHSFAALPLLKDANILGVLSVASTAARDFSEQAAFLEALAAEISIGLQNALLHQQLKQHAAAMEKEVKERKRIEKEIDKHRKELQKLSAQLIETQEQERKRISQELHDEVGQALTAAKINLSAIEKDLPSNVDPDLKERLKEIAQLTDRVLEQIHELSLDLHPAMLDELGLIPTLRWYLNRYSKRSNIAVDFKAMNVKERLTPGQETVLYRVVQEAMTNVARHARAGHVRVHIERENSFIEAVIEDDGKGFDPDKVCSHGTYNRGIGLLGMQERLNSIAGHMEIRSTPDKGTRLSIKIPIKAGLQ